ncbi:MAG: hypothetical protein AB7N71_12235 [Phycisphaerae bacterium]
MEPFSTDWQGALAPTRHALASAQRLRQIEVQCHIARVAHRRGPAVPEPVVASATMPDFLQARVRTIVAKWREESIIIREVQRVVETENLPGIALWYADAHETIPMSIPPDFAGRELTEADEAVRRAGEPVMSKAPAAPPGLWHKLTQPWREMMMRADVPTGPVMAIGAAIAIVLLYRPFEPSWINFAILAVFTLILITRQMFRPVWHLHEHGVELRRWWRRNRSHELVTPRDAVLIVRQTAIGWTAALHFSSREINRTLTAREARVMLSWWQGMGRA